MILVHDFPTFSVLKYSIYKVIKKASPIGIPSKAMMTIATLMVDCTTSWCPSLPPTISHHSSTLQELNVSSLTPAAFVTKVLTTCQFYKKFLPGFLKNLPS